MELEPVAPQAIRADRREAVGLDPRRTGGRAELLEVGPDRGDAVEVAHPDALDGAETAEERVWPRHVEFRVPPLAAAVDDRAAVVLGDLLVAEAEAQHRDGQVVDRLRVFGVLAMRRQAGAAGQDEPLVAGEPVDRILRLADLGVHAEAADLGGDEVGVLAAEVDHADGVVLVHRRILTAIGREGTARAVRSPCGRHRIGADPSP